MKILILQDDFPPRAIGGPARVAADLARGLHAQGHEVQIITTVPTMADAGIYDYYGMKVHALQSSYAWRWQAYLGLYNPATIPSVKRIIVEFKPDVVHAHNIHYRISYHALRLAKRAGATVLLTAHDVMLFHYGKLHDFYDPNDLSAHPPVQYKISPWRQLRTYRFRYNPFRNAIIKWYLRNCDHVIAVSEELKKALEANGIRVTDVVYSGIDVEHWAATTTDARKTYALGDRPVLLFAGRLSEAKGGEQTLAMLTEVVKRIPDVVLLVAGRKDGYGERMQEKAEELGIEKNLVFTEWLEGDELVGIYHAANVVLFPSICFDTFGLVNVEAMAAQKPVVATCFGGAPEAIENGVTGTLVNPRNVSAYADAVMAFLTNPEKAANYGAEGIKRVRARFTLQQYVAHTLALYTAPKRPYTKLFIFPKSTIEAGGSRHRAFFLATFLERSGYNAEIVLAPHYRTESGTAAEWAYLKKIFSFRKGDLLFLQNPIFSTSFIICIGVVKLLFNPTIIFDFDDATWVQKPIAPRVLAFFSDKYVVASHYLAKWEWLKGKPVLVMPNLVDYEMAERYGAPKDFSTTTDPVVMGWIGGAPASMPNLKLLLPVFKRLAEQSLPVSFLLVGSYDSPDVIKAFSSTGIPTEYVDRLEWGTEGEIQKETLRFDIGLCPLEHSVSNEARCSLKVLDYMSMGIPVVISPVGENRYFIREGEEGFLPRTEDAWVDALTRLITDRALRARMGAAGYERLKTNYSYQANTARYVDFLGLRKTDEIL